ncbi:MAG TPA: tRNA pseudouridine(38-40) synthase TruA [Dehalococcoidia bacterium]|nr:tRNA pseudouridine(38-40) synthase TruA [Dehalococcoidia bacterium]
MVPEMTRFAATVSYDGEEFAGSQRQLHVRTVQGQLEDAAERLFGTTTRVELAGRTDAGVHAIGQVAAFSATTALESETVERALNAHLPEDVAVVDVREVPKDFDPRRWARLRWYRYSLLMSAARLPLQRRTAWRIGTQLDLAAMKEAGRTLIGRRDFSACAGPLEENRSPVRTVADARFSQSGCLLAFDIEAEAFLPQMVRRIVGGLVGVGRGASSTSEFESTVASAKPATVGPTAPPHGLCLQRVWYDEGYAI